MGDVMEAGRCHKNLGQLPSEETNKATSQGKTRTLKEANLYFGKDLRVACFSEHLVWL